MSKSKITTVSTGDHTNGNREAASLVRRAQKMCSGHFSTKQGAEAFSLLQQAASEGSAEAHYAIGTWYLFGKHVTKDSRKAVQHIRKAARDKYPPAMFDLAVLHETGRGVSRNKSLAFKFYVGAARGGDTDAIGSVGRCLYHGIGTKRNRLVAELILDQLESLTQNLKARAPRPVQH